MPVLLWTDPDEDSLYKLNNIFQSNRKTGLRSFIGGRPQPEGGRNDKSTDIMAISEMNNQITDSRRLSPKKGIPDCKKRD